MHFNSFLSFLAGLRLVVPSSAVPGFPAHSSLFEYTSRLKPVNVRDLEVAADIRRRGVEDLSALDFQTQSQLIYGRSGDLFLYFLD